MCVQYRTRLTACAVAVTFCLTALEGLAQSSPYGHTLSVGPVRATSATLNGAVVPNGLATWTWFEWGQNHAFDHSTTPVSAGNGSVIRYPRVFITGLESNGVFQCRLVASNSAGVVVGHPQLFTTGARLAAWGDPYDGLMRLPKGGSNFVALAGGVSSHNVVQQNDGVVSVLAYSAQLTSVPAGATNIAAVAAGYNYCLALRSNGTALGWPPGHPGFFVTSLSDIVALAAGGTHVLGLRSTGRVVANGNNDSGQVSVPNAATNVVAVSAGYKHSAALRADGRVLVWGDNSDGQTKVPSTLSNVVAIACGYWHTIALKRDGTVASWGDDIYGIGHLQVPPGLSNVVAIAAGGSFSLALKIDGTVVAWGANESGEATIPAAIEGVISVAAGGDHSIVLAPNFAPQVGSETFVGPANHDLTVALQTADLNNDDLSLRITGLPANGILFQFAGGGRGAPILSPGSLVSDPMGRVIFAPDPDEFGSPYTSFEFVANDGAINSAVGTIGIVVVGKPYVALHHPGPIATNSARLRGMVVANGLPTTVWFEWGINGVLSQATAPMPVGADAVVQPVYSQLGSLVPGQFYSVRLVASNAAGLVRGAERKFVTGGRIAAWGRQTEGQSRPPPGLLDAVAVAGGSDHSLALRADGKPVAWGNNFGGQTNVPPFVTNIIAVAGGGNYSAALEGNGQPFVWGYNYNEVTNIPPGVSNIFDLAAGGGHVLALRTDGTLIAWGNNSYGQTNVPVGLSNVVAIAAGGVHSLALKADGTIVAWGWNANGQAVVPAGLSNVVTIACGALHNVVAAADGSVIAWGHNGSGQTTNFPPGLTNVISVSAGAAHSIALTATGSLLAWGYGGYGQTNIPVGLRGVAVLAAGDYHNLALASNVPPTATAVTASGIANHDIMLTLSGNDVNGDPLVFRISTLPSKGYLYQFDSGSRGAPIVAPGTPVSDVGGRIIFAPETNSSGLNYASFSFMATDGELESPPATATIDITGTTYAHTAPPTTITLSGATLNGIVTPNGLQTVAWFEWGTNLAFGQTTAPVPVGDDGGMVRVSATLSNLVFGRVYWSRIVASNAVSTIYGVPKLWTARAKIATWGFTNSNFPGPLVPPASATNVVAITTGPFHSLGLRRDGTVVAWGHNGSGKTNVPPGLTNVVGIAAGYYGSAAVRSQGTVAGWGSIGSPPAALSNVVSVSLQSDQGLALDATGVIKAWKSGVFHTVPVSLSNIVAMTENLAVRNDGRVFTWTAGSASVSMVTNLTNVVAVAAGSEHYLALKSDGTVVAWGTGEGAAVPVGLSNVVAIAAAEAYSLALKADGTLAAWGYYWDGITGFPAGLSNVVDVVSGGAWARNLALVADTSVVANSGSVTGFVNTDLTIALPVYHPFGAPVTNRVTSLPLTGTLFQFEHGTRGAVINTTNTIISDAAGRIIFAPQPNAIGNPYTSFTFSASDGTTNTGPHTVTIAIILPPPPILDALASGWTLLTPPALNQSALNRGSNGSFGLLFAGQVNVSYGVWVSTNLVHWSLLETMTPTANGWLQFVDNDSTNWSRRFYRISVPNRRAYNLNFTGMSNATYRVWASTNLSDWQLLGPGSATSNGWFNYLDSDVGNFPQRFYKAGAP